MNKMKPAFEKNNIAVTFAANDYFAPFMSAAIQSIIDTRSKKNNYDINILHINITENNQNKILSMADNYKNVSIRFVNVKDYVDISKLYTDNRDTITVEAYFRLLIPYIFPDYEKMVYLDGDMIIKRDIADLYNENMDGYMLASSRDLWGISEYNIKGSDCLRWRKSIGIKEPDNYFISGMLVFNIPEINKKYTIDDVMKVAYSRKWVQHDQDVLNVMFQDSLKLLSVKWDFMYGFAGIYSLPEHLFKEYEEALHEHYITHYGTTRKPWTRVYYPEYMEFWDAASRTPFFNYIFSCIEGHNDYKVNIIENVFKKLPELKWDGSTYRLKYDDILDYDIGKTHSNIHIIKIEDNSLIIEGDSPVFGIEDNKYEIFIKAGNEVYESEKVKGNEDGYRRSYSSDKPVYFSNRFKFIIPLDKVTKKGLRIILYCRYKGKEFKKPILKYKHHCPVNNLSQNSYFYKDGFVLTGNKRSILIRKSSRWLHFKKELLFLLTLFFANNFSAIGYRFMYAILKPFTNKKIWMFQDRTNKADDNAEAMFDYVNSLKRKDLKTYFILLKDCKDYRRMKKKGKVLKYQSFRHRLNHLLCEMNLSSHADMPILYPFTEKQLSGLMDLLQKQKYIFLQHGIISSDISRYFNYYNLKYSLFCVTVKKEYEAVLNNYGYNVDDSILKLTGLARHDKLFHKEENIVTIMPTWRKEFTVRKDSDLGIWKPKDNFKSSDYFKFYNSLINNEKLIKVAKEYNYKIYFFPHPNIMSAINLFDKNDSVTFLKPSSRYSKVFSKTKLVVTDYSSAVLDFVYLKKPMVYTQFDRDTFFSGKNISVGQLYNYETEGFGEVETTLDGAVDRIIEYIKNDCKLKKKYENRINKFFTYNDKNNCKRIYDEIMKLDK